MRAESFLCVLRAVYLVCHRNCCNYQEVPDHCSRVLQKRRAGYYKTLVPSQLIAGRGEETVVINPGILFFVSPCLMTKDYDDGVWGRQALSTLNLLSRIGNFAHALLELDI